MPSAEGGVTPPANEQELDQPALLDRSAREESRLLRWDAALRRAAAEEERAEAARQRAQAALHRAAATRELAHSAEQRADGARKRVQKLREDLDRFLAALTHAAPVAAPPHPEMDAVNDLDAEQREEIADRRERLADERDAEADERERIADLRDAEADVRERRAERREHQGAPPRRAPLREAPAHPPSTSRANDARYRALLDQGAWLRTRAASIAEALADEAEVTAAAFEEPGPHVGANWRSNIAATERKIAHILRGNAEKLRQAGPSTGGLASIPRLPAREPSEDAGD